MSSNPTTNKTVEEGKQFAFQKENYVILLIGLAFLAVGFLLMLGGGSDNPEEFSDALFDFRRLTLAPILILTGYIIEIYAIMKRPKQKHD